MSLGFGGIAAGKLVRCIVWRLLGAKSFLDGGETYEGCCWSYERLCKKLEDHFGHKTICEWRASWRN